MVYADSHVYKSNDRTMKGFPAQKTFPINSKLGLLHGCAFKGLDQLITTVVFMDEWAGFVAAAKLRLVRADDESYGNWKLTRFEDSMTIPFSGSGPVTFSHPSELSSGEANKYWTNDYGTLGFSEDEARATQPRGGGFLWKKVDGYELEQLFWDRETYDRAKADDSIQWGRLDVLCRGINTNAWRGELTDEVSP